MTKKTKAKKTKIERPRDNANFFWLKRFDDWIILTSDHRLFAVNSNDCRRAASWLLRAAEYLEGK